MLYLVLDISRLPLSCLTIPPGDVQSQIEGTPSYVHSPEACLCVSVKFVLVARPVIPQLKQLNGKNLT